jgi:hypothetical protein
MNYYLISHQVVLLTQYLYNFLKNYQLIEQNIHQIIIKTTTM